MFTVKFCCHKLFMAILTLPNEVYFHLFLVKLLTVAGNLTAMIFELLSSSKSCWFIFQYFAKHQASLKNLPQRPMSGLLLV